MRGPTISTTGPQYAQKINTALLNVVDGHDHTPGFGVNVPSAGININTDLPFGGFSATGLLAAAFNSQSADPSGNARIYFKNGEMYATDGSGNHVQITSGGNVNVGSVGAISGMGGTSATVSYSNATKVFTFNQAANQTALIKVGDLQITDSSVTSGSAVTLKVPAGLASSYTLTMPGTLPARTTIAKVAGSGASGTVSFAALTRPDLPAIGQQVSSSSGAFNTGSTSFTAVTNLSVTITTTGRPVVLAIQPSSATGAQFGATSASTSCSMTAAFSSDGGSTFFGAATISNTGGTTIFVPGHHYLWVPSANTYSVAVYVKAGLVSTPTAVVNSMVLVAYEL